MSLDFNDFDEDAVLDEFALSKSPLNSVVYFPEGTKFRGDTVTEARLMWDPLYDSMFWMLSRGDQPLVEEATTAEIAKLRPRRAPYTYRKVGLCYLLTDNRNVYATTDTPGSTPQDVIDGVMEAFAENGYHTIVNEDGSACAILRDQVKEVRAYYA